MRRSFSGQAGLLLGLLCGSRLRVARVGAAVTYADLESVPTSTSLADSFKVSLVRPEDEPPNSGNKVLVPMSSVLLLNEEEQKVLDDYDAIFEKYSMFCNGRWLGAQVLQDSQDLLYLQHVVYKKRPDIIIETGTYKGGLTYFFASILDWIDRESGSSTASTSARQSTVLSVDRHHPDLVFAANWFCPVCADCIKAYETDVWDRKVRFIQGLADKADTYNEVIVNLVDLGFLLPITPEAVSTRRVVGALDPGTGGLEVNTSKVVVVNLDANHEYPGLLHELFFYAPLVTENSYLIVQDAKLDKIWGTLGPTAALNTFLEVAPKGEFVIEPELHFHGYSQHIYVRRVQVTVGHAFFVELASKTLLAQATERAAKEAAKANDL